MPFITTSVPLDHMMPPYERFATLMLPVVWLDDETGLTHTAHAGMITDGASVPRMFWRLIPPFRSHYLAAAMIHDHYCYKAMTMPPGDDREFVRREADAQFARMCGDLGAGYAMRLTLHRSVAIGSFLSRNDPVAPDYIRQPAEFRDWILSR